MAARVTDHHQSKTNMADLRCEEVLSVLEDPETHQLQRLQAEQDDDGTAAHYCEAYRDPAILDDNRVFRNMLQLEEFYLPHR